MTNLLDILDPASMDLDLTADTKADAVRQLVALMGKAGAVSDAQLLTDAVMAREELSTTGLGDGIAIPHGKSDGVSRPAVAFARSTSGVPWGASDGSPANLMFLIGVPEAEAGDAHLRILAMLARKLVRADFRKGLLEAADADAVREVLAAVKS
jgi:PTS system fructose-specific IIA component